MRSFIDEQVVIKTNGGFKVTQKIDNMVIPHTINDVLTARIDRLEEKTRDLVKVASVIGRNFFYRILAEVAASVDGIDRRLSYLKEIELIRERRRMEELEYLFKHALAQEAAYESILLQKRKNLHLQVARSIEKIFDERLHEFFGMLALHYIKGEDNEKAEYYLVKAGEEALRSSASSEALNYYQEGLKFYLQANQDKAEPKKLAMFEKNIAIALFNKCRWEEAVEHIDKVFTYWNIPANPNKVFSLIRFFKNICFLFAGVGQFSQKTKPTPTQKETEVLDLVYKKGNSLANYDNLLFFFELLYCFNLAIKFDIFKSSEAFRSLTGPAGGMAFGGASFKIPYKILGFSEKNLDKNAVGSYMSYICMKAMVNHVSGNLLEVGSFEKALINKSFAKGFMWDASTYLSWLNLMKIDMGQFSECNAYTSKLFDLGNAYDYEYATLLGNISKSYLGIVKRNILRWSPKTGQCAKL